MSAIGRAADFALVKEAIVKAVRRDPELTMSQLRARFSYSALFITKALDEAGLKIARPVATFDKGRAVGASIKLIRRVKRVRGVR